MDTDNSNVAFIGLGVMGYHMAINLRSKMDSRRTLVIADVSKETLRKFVEETLNRGPVEIASNGIEAVQKADAVITVLPNDEAMRSVYLDDKTGILAGIQAGNCDRRKTLIECGTMSLECINQVRDACTDLGTTFADAPISGGPMGSQAATLTFMVGSSAELFPTLEKLLDHMGTSVVHCGDVGAGTAFKTINNYISINTVLIACEALNIGAKLNLDLKRLVDTINSSSGQSWVTSKNNPVPGIHPNAPASHGYSGGFKIELGQKDLRLGLKLAEMAGARAILPQVTLGALEEAAADPRYAGKDLRVLYKWLNEQ